MTALWWYFSRISNTSSFCLFLKRWINGYRFWSLLPDSRGSLRLQSRLLNLRKLVKPQRGPVGKPFGTNTASWTIYKRKNPSHFSFSSRCFQHHFPISFFFFSLSLIKLFQFYIVSRIMSNEQFYLVYISLKTLHFTFWQCKLTSIVPGIQWNIQQMESLLSLLLSWKNISFVIRCFLRNKMSLIWIIIEQVIIVAEQNYMYFNFNLILITTP